MTTLDPLPTLELDVRTVAPKHQFEVIVGAYRTLPVGGRLDLTADHDPGCMCFTLRAEHGDEAFDFAYLAYGPEVWRVVITKRWA
jgi:uncharacterized protein (DUF2249 family)